MATSLAGWRGQCGREGCEREARVPISGKKRPGRRIPSETTTCRLPACLPAGRERRASAVAALVLPRMQQTQPLEMGRLSTLK